MAINYESLFTCLGELVQQIDYFREQYDDLQVGLDEIVSGFESQSAAYLTEGIFQQFDSYRNAMFRGIQDMQNRATRVLTDRELVREQLFLGDAADLETVIRTLFRDMVDNSETIRKNTTTIDNVVKTLANSGDGGLVYGAYLDGFNNPHPTFISNPLYAGRLSELAFTDTLTLECVQDSFSDGVEEGSETFQILGHPSSPGFYHWQTNYAGTGVRLGTLQRDSILTNCQFEDFEDTANVPDDWTLDTGTAGTHVFKETSGAQIHRGSAALRLTGNASLAAIQLSRDIVDNVTPRRRYTFGFWIKGDAGISSGTLTIQCEGTGYTASSSEKIELNAAALAALTSYGWYSASVTIPEDVPEDFELVIKWTGTPSAHSIRIDGGGFAPAVYYAGIHLHPYAGASSTPFVRGDRITVDVENDEDGSFQTFFRNTFGAQLPSDTEGTISDDLAGDVWG